MNRREGNKDNIRFLNVDLLLTSLPSAFISPVYHFALPNGSRRESQLKQRSSAVKSLSWCSWNRNWDCVLEMAEIVLTASDDVRGSEAKSLEWFPGWGMTIQMVVKLG